MRIGVSRGAQPYMLGDAKRQCVKAGLGKLHSVVGVSYRLLVTKVSASARRSGGLKMHTYIAWE